MQAVGSLKVRFALFAAALSPGPSREGRGDFLRKTKYKIIL